MRKQGDENIAATKHVTLWCDDERSPACHNHIQLAAEDLREATEEAEQQDWQCLRERGNKRLDICPACWDNVQATLRARVGGY